MTLPESHQRKSTISFTAKPELRRALSVRARQEATSITALVTRLLEEALLRPREIKPGPPAGERLNNYDGRGLARFLKAGPDA